MRTVAVRVQHVLRCCDTSRSSTLQRGRRRREGLIHVEEDVVVGHEIPLACVRLALWGMLYADDSGTVCRWRGLLKR